MADLSGALPHLDALSFHGRAETGTYLKGLSAGASDLDPSPEVQQAVIIARGREA
jgi:hypothetical protein